jgi:hypothetical protein
MSTALTYHSSYIFETVKVDKDEEEEVTLPVKICTDCDSVVFFEGDKLCRQFAPKREEFIFTPQINDDQIHLINK